MTSPIASLDLKQQLQISVALHRDGVVVLNDLYSATFVQQVRQEYLKYLERLEALLQLRQLEAPLTYGNCVARVKGRYEHLFDIFGEEPELLSEQALVSKELRAIVSTVLGTDEIRLEIGGVPAMPNAPVGRYHRDTFDLFGDQVDTQLPPWYLTLVIPLVDAVDDQQGPTSFLLGTHRVPVNRLGDESKWQGEKAYLKAGQAALFDGRIIHRGEANNTSSIRPFLFMVFTAPWYIDKEADQLDRLSASPVA